MAVHITVEAVQSWIDKTLLSVVDVDDDLEAEIVNLVFGRAERAYETATWLDIATTPRLIRTVIAIRYAAAFYRRKYAESGEGSPAYADWLEKTADDILSGIVDGLVDLVDVAGEVGIGTGPVFYPDDDAGVLAYTTDIYGNIVETDHSVRFLIGQVF